MIREMCFLFSLEECVIYLFLRLFFFAQGLLQSEIVQDGSNQVGFFGKCQSHGMCSSTEAEDVMKEDPCFSSGGVCARTEVNVLYLWFFFFGIQYGEFKSYLVEVMNVMFSCDTVGLF